MYSLVIINNEEIKNTKGVYNNVVKNLRHKEYVDALFKRNLIRHKMIWIQSKLHKLELMMFVKLLCLVLMIKGIFLMMILKVWLIFIRLEKSIESSKVNKINRIK